MRALWQYLYCFVFAHLHNSTAQKIYCRFIGSSEVMINSHRVATRRGVERITQEHGPR